MAISSNRPAAPSVAAYNGITIDLGSQDEAATAALTADRNPDDGPDEVATAAGAAQAQLNSAVASLGQTSPSAGMQRAVAAAEQNLVRAQDMRSAPSRRAASLDEAEENLLHLRQTAVTAAALDAAASPDGTPFEQLLDSALGFTAEARGRYYGTAPGGGAAAAGAGAGAAAQGEGATDASAGAVSPPSPARDDRANEAGAAQTGLNAAMQGVAESQWSAQMRSLYQAASKYLVDAQDMLRSVVSRGESLDQAISALGELQRAGAATASVDGPTLPTGFSAAVDVARQAAIRARSYR